MPAESYQSLIEVYVQPYYLQLLHANFLSGESEHFPEYLRLAASTVGTGRLRRLFRDRDWRSGLAAGWFAGIGRHHELTNTIAARLGSAMGAYDVQGLCFGLGLLGGDLARSSLRKYLEENIADNSEGGERSWALGALAYCDGEPPQQYMHAGLWRDSDDNGPMRAVREFSRIVKFLKLRNVINNTSCRPF